MRKQELKRLYHLQELSINDLKSMYDEYASTHNLHKHYDQKVREAIEVLIHFIISNQISNYDRKKEEMGIAHINAEKGRLIIGDCYDDVRQFLLDSEIILKVENYIVDKQSIGYIINDKYTIKEYYVSQLYLHQYLDKINIYIIDKTEVKSKEERKFRKQYTKCLNELKIVDSEDFRKFYKTLTFLNKEGEYSYNKELSYNYHRDICLSKKKKDVYSWDEYGRIHHYLSNCPKSFRPFFNILFVRDLHNAQPLLIASLLFDYYNIDINIRQYISYSIVNNLYLLNYKEIIKFEYNKEGRFSFSYIPYHYAVRSSYNELNNNNLEEIKNKISLIPIDVLEYIYLVIKGVFWDVVCNRLGIAREEAKGTMFAELFYSKTNSVRDWQRYGQMFQAYFPNATAAIMEIKSSHPINWLAHEMQRRESQIIRSVLSFLFDKGYDVVNIHDEIVVIDTPNNLSKYAVDAEGTNIDVIEQDVERAMMLELFSQLGIEGSLGCE